MNSTPLTDQSPMPFGKHKGTPLAEVPVRYLLWLWKNGLKDKNTPLSAWIWDSFDTLIEKDQAEGRNS